MKIVFMGTPQAAVPSLERVIAGGHEIVAVYTKPDKPSGRGRKIIYSPVKEFAARHNLPIFQPIKIKTPHALETFRSHNADATVVVAYGRILPESFLRAFPKGAINVHFSLLPKYRGAAPVNWAVVHDEARTGVTTMQMDSGLDTGDILLQRATDIGNEETAVELTSRLAIIGADLLSETLAIYDELSPQPQSEDESTYAPVLKKEDGKISWMLSASEIDSRVRGFQPFPTAFTFYKEKRVKIWKAEKISNLKSEISNLKSEISNLKSEISNPGKILRATGDDLIVACGGDSFLKIEELQLEGKRRMSARDFINGMKPKIGEILV